MTVLTIYAPLEALAGGWLVKLLEGWRFCGCDPEPILGWTVLMWRPGP